MPPKKKNLIPPKHRKKRIRPSQRKRVTLHLVCEWQQCDETFSSVQKFTEHVQNHLYTVFHQCQENNGDFTDIGKGWYFACNALWRQGSYPTLKTWKTWNFVIYFSRPGKCPEFAQKVKKKLEFYLTQNLEKT